MLNYKKIKLLTKENAKKLKVATLWLKTAGRDLQVKLKETKNSN